MEFVSPEIWVSSFSMFFDSFPQLAVRYLLNLATALQRECQVLGAASALPAAVFIHGGSHALHTRTCGHEQPLGTRTLVHGGHVLVSVHAETAPRCRSRQGSEAQTPARTSVSIVLSAGTGTAVTDALYMSQTDLPMPRTHDAGDKSCGPWTQILAYPSDVLA